MPRNMLRPGACNCVSRRDPADIVLSVEDDGTRGSTNLAPKAGMGLLGMQERVASLGGTLRFERRPEGGARLLATIPNIGPES